MITQIRDILDANPHWTTLSLPKSNFTYHRNLFHSLLPWISEREIVVITGLRRVGKSVMLEQLAQEFCNRHCVDSNTGDRVRSLFRFSFETDDFHERLPRQELVDVLDYYFDSVLHTPPALVTHRVVIVLDEIQNVTAWQTVIKRYYDLNPQIKFLISGSSAVFLKKDGESLAGRIIHKDLLPLSFSEFLSITGVHTKIPQYANVDELLSLPPYLITNELRDLFENFIICGGFPECAVKLQKGMCVLDIQSYIRDSIIKKIVAKDLTRYYGLKSPLRDFELFKQLCRETGSIINVTTLAKDVGYSEETIVKHLDIFEESHLCVRLQKFETKKRRIIKGKYKLYISSPSIIMSVLGIDHLKDRRFVGHVIESYILMRLLTITSNIFFAHNETSKEVDFFSQEHKLIVECKYGESSSQELKFLHELGERYSYRTLLITENYISNLAHKITQLPAMLV